MSDTLQPSNTSIAQFFSDPFQNSLSLPLFLALLNVVGDTKLLPFIEEPGKHDTNKH